MIKLISAVFTAGVAVGIAIVVRQRRIANKTEQPTETVDYPSNDEVTEPEEPVAVPAG